MVSVFLALLLALQITPFDVRAKENLVFGNVIAQSASVWWVPGNADAAPRWLMQDIVEKPKRNLRVFMNVGLITPGLWHEI